jgi:serine/threonine-protein kinase
MIIRGRAWPATVKGRERLRTGLILGGAALAGYLVTCVAYPAPLISRDHSVVRVLGLPRTGAEQELEARGFRSKVEAEEPDPVIPAGHVVWQDPPPETVVPAGTTVQLTLSSGPNPITVPDVVSFELSDARTVIEAAGLRVGSVDTIASASEAGVIVTTRPATGVNRSAGSTVDLVVSKGPANIRVPDVTGLRQEDARERLEAVGLKVGTITTRQSRRGGAGIVIEQRPAAGVFSPQEARVNLVISQ